MQTLSLQQAARDELIDESGRLRPVWRRLLGTLLGLGTATLRERTAQLDRALAEEGPASLSPVAGGAWRCDPIPLLLEPQEFAALEAGLGQRASLLSAVLEDAYGAGRLVDGGVLPPALLFAGGRYLFPCRGAPGAGLLFYAADLLRRPDGQWCVVADHTAAPAGLARALLNRRLMARVLPELFRSLDVAPLSPFFERFAASLAALGPAESPLPALLTHGHADPNWFEHMLLSQELGCTLVQPGDLTVRQGKLWLKTLRGLQPVDGLLRMVQGTAIDPLECPGAATRGVPGLLTAMRAGRVWVANGPGVGLAEAPALPAFLPLLCRHLRGETLALPDAETLWLGDADARARVAATPASYAVREDAARALPPASYAPGVGPGETLEPLPVRLRMFLIRDRAGWHALPGGLARVESGPSAGMAKDVWVRLEEPEDIAGSHPPPVPSPAVRRTVGDLPSRTADDFYWFGRYLERLEHAARLSRALLGRLSRASLLPHDLAEMTALSACLVDAGVLSPELASQAGPAVLGELLTGALAREGGAMAAAKRDVQHLADALRDRLSGEMHAMIVQGVRALDASRAALLLRPDPGVRPGLASLGAHVGRVIAFCAGVSGYAAENMVRGGGRLFLDLGRRIERAQGTAAALARLFAGAPGDAALGLALELCDSTITYRTRYRGLPQTGPVLDLVLADEGNPRSLGFQLAAAASLLEGLEAEELARLLNGTLASVREMAARADAGGLWAVRAEAARISDAVTRRYFSLLPVTWTGTQR